MNGLISSANIRAGLVIGIHKKELDFGRKVAANLSETDIKIIQIDQGLPQQEAFHNRGYYYSTFHREIYLQLHQQVKNKIDLMIDLHTGINESGRCADFFRNDECLLNRIQKTLNKKKVNISNNSQAIHFFKITTISSKEHSASKSFPVCHTIIPGSIWESAPYSYVGLEIYLQEPGKGKQADWSYGAMLVKSIISDFILQK